MATNDFSLLCSGLLRAERNFHIPATKSSIIGKGKPDDETEAVPREKTRRNGRAVINARTAR